MSQVGISRPPSQFGGSRMGVNLPQIQHPLSRMSVPGNMDIRGTSRDGARPNSLPEGRPLTTESEYGGKRKVFSAQGRDSRFSQRREPLAASYPIGTIPEGVEVTQGDPNRTRMPIFGNRADMGSRGELQSRMSSRLSRASQSRLEIDELETLLKHRVKNNYQEVRKKFRDNDPESKGNVSREALYRILMTLISRDISQSQYTRVMERLGFKDRKVISYTDFFSAFRDQGSLTTPSGWTQSRGVGRIRQPCPRHRFLDIAELIPQMNPGGTGRILKPEFKQMLNRMMFYLDDDEFEKLWQRYDNENTGAINGEKFLNRLGITLRPESNGGHRFTPTADSEKSRTPRRKEIERKQSLDIERWLKSKFREGCNKMRYAFEDKDPESKGVVSFDEFLDVMCQYGLKLEKNLLAAFLARCSVKARRDGVPYREFLHRFQDRSEIGMTHNILTSKNHRLVRLLDGARPGTDSGKSTLGALEVQMMNMFQKDFLSLLGTFKSIDKLGLNVISQQEFRAAIESRFNLQLLDEQFDGFLDRLPLDEDGNVKYAEFMQQFDTKGMAPSLFEGGMKTQQVALESGPQPIPQPKLSTSPRQPTNQPPSPLSVDRLVVDHPMEETYQAHRSTRELFRIIKDLLTRRYQDVEKSFHELDDINSRRLSQEQLFQLLKKFDIKPAISRGEIRDLWKTFITNTDKTLEYLQFVRHFGFSMRSAAFPNSKVNPPRRGDADFMMRSRKLNCAADMLQDSLRAKVDYLWEDLRKEFVELDPYGTGFIGKDEFREVMTELCVHLSDYELELLCQKFDLRDDGRVSYVEFLKPFAMRKQIWRHGNNMLSLLTHPQPELPIGDIVSPPQKGLHGITSKLRQKLAGDWKNLRRAFRKLDTHNEGYLSVPEFRSVLKLANVILDEDEVYHVMTQFDENMSGKIPYERFIEETFKPPSRQGGKK
ncbi:hypothetical protein ScPMuIL_004480 [Solemya velum]